MRPSEFLQTNPVRLDVSRSKFHMDPRWTGSFKAFQLVPIHAYTLVLPGDTFRYGMSMAVRMSTPLVPVMDDLWLDVAFYFVPFDLLLSRSYMSPSTSDSNHSWKAFIGAQDSLLNMPIPANGITLPKCYIASKDYQGGFQYLVGGLADMLKYGPAKSGQHRYTVNCLKILSFMAVWNENYRDPNSQNPGVFSISSGECKILWDAAGASYAQADLSNLFCPNVCRFHGYFGSSLPWPQRNLVGVGLSLTDPVPLVTGADYLLKKADGTGNGFLDFGVSSSSLPNGYHTLATSKNGTSPNGVFAANTVSSSTFDYQVDTTNLYADLAAASAITVNALRQAVQEQRWYEALARSGNNGLDVLTAGMFGVVRKDAGYNRVEYLGGKRIPINVTQVNSTNGDQTGKLGETGAFSLTNDSDYYFTKSFDTWGAIIGVACVRYRDSFGTGVESMDQKFDRFQYYWPQFANLGEMPVYMKEIATPDGIAADDDAVFGYQEAWAEYRTMRDAVVGLARPGENLDHWTYASSFDNGQIDLPTFITGVNAADNIDHTLQVSSSTSGFQFFGQFQFDVTAVRPIPTYSIPGLVDHH